MRLTEYRKVCKKTEVTIGYTCDVCGKKHIGEDIPESWHELSGHHNSWGNDSIDSYQDYIVCSIDCYTKMLKDFIKAFEDEIDPEINGFTLEFTKLLYNKLNKE